VKTSDLYQSVTAGIIADLERGAPPWIKPWKDGRVGGTGLMPANAATGRLYSGINIPILWGAADARGFPTHRWMTFRQAIEKDAAVRKGERGTHVVFVRRVTVGEDDEERQVAMARVYVVFNVAQIDGLSEETPAPPQSEPERHHGAERFIEATAADIQIGGSQAMFVPSRDYIAMPPLALFNTPESYYATALHELGHWSGHASRLDRQLANRFGSRAYAAEELIAELTAAFLCAHLGLKGELRHAGYIGSWVGLLRDDPRAIFTAASKASQAADFLRGFSETVEEGA
jgi:antirestriction protein ArdC